MRRPLARADPRAPVGQAWSLSGAAIAAAVFFASYISWRPADILFTLSDGLFIMGAAFLVAAHRMPLTPMGRASAWWLLATFTMLAGLFLGSIINGNPDRWLIAGAQYMFSLVILPLLLMNQGEARTIRYYRALIAGVVAMELFGIILYFGFDLSFEQYNRISHEFVTGAGRLAAFLGDANWNACAIVMTMPFTYYLRVRRLMNLPVFCFVMAVSLGGLFLAASVTGLTSGVIAAVIFAGIAGIRPSARALLAVGAVIMIYFASGYGLPRAFEKRIAPALEDGNLQQAGTYKGRMELIHEAWQMVEGTTFVGIGVDQYREVSADKAPVHNIYLLLWAEGGLLALFGWIALLVILAMGALAARRTDKLAAALGLSVLSTFIIFSNAAPHMYARMWVVPLLLAMSPAFVINAAGASRRFTPGAAGWGNLRRRRLT